MQGSHPQGSLSQPTLFPEVGEKHYTTSFSYRKDLKIILKYVTGVKKNSRLVQEALLVLPASGTVLGT